MTSAGCAGAGSESETVSDTIAVSPIAPARANPAKSTPMRERPGTSSSSTSTSEDSMSDCRGPIFTGAASLRAPQKGQYNAFPGISCLHLLMVASVGTFNHKDVWIIEKFKVGPRPPSEISQRAFHAVVCYVFARERGVEMKYWAFLLLISLALAVGCQSKQEPPPPPAQEESADGDSPRQIIKNGSITIELESLESAHKSVEKLI